MSKLPQFLILAMMSILFIGIASAGNVTIANTSLSSLNATQITPNSTYQYLNTTFSVNVSDNVSLTNYAWYLNNTLINSSTTNITNGTINYTFNYNFTGTLPLTFIANDSLNNSVNSTQNITFNKYILPTISSITPSNSTVNVSTIWQAVGTEGSFPIANVTWDMQDNYFTNLGFNGDNYLSYAFNQSGNFATIVQICDINGFCSESTTNLYIASNEPSSYWEVSNASMIINLNPPNQEMMTLTWIPVNDTYSISQVNINWGDGSPIQQVIFSSAGTTQYTFEHQYSQVGHYNVSVTTCDTEGNCYSQSIATVNYVQNVVGGVGQLLLNSNPNTNEGDIFTTLINNLGNIFGVTIDTAIGSILFSVLIVIVSILVILVGGMMFWHWLNSTKW